MSEDDISTNRHIVSLCVLFYLFVIEFNMNCYTLYCTELFTN